MLVILLIEKENDTMSDSSTTNSKTSTSNKYSIAPDTNSNKDTLTNTFNITNLVTGYSHALQNTSVEQIPGDTSSWFPKFLANLQTAQKHAQVWTDSLGPAICSTIPQSIVTYNDIFKAVSTDILNIVNSCMNNLDADGNAQITKQQIQEIDTYIKILNNKIGIITKASDGSVSVSPKGSILYNVYDLKDQLDTFVSNIEADYTNLVNGQNSAQQEVDLDDTDIESINNKISVLNADIQSKNTMATVSELDLVVGFFVSVVCISLAAVSGGASLVVGSIVGVGMLGTGIAGTVIYNEDIAKDKDQIYSLQQNMNDEQKQVAALQGIITSIESLETYNTEIKNALSDIMTTWTTLQGKLKEVSNELASALNDESTIEAETVPANTILDLINEQVDMQDAQNAWSDLSDFANKILDSYANTQVTVTTTDGATTTVTKG